MTKRVGFTCAYAPLPMIHAAGFVPYRVLPVGEAPDQAGMLLHDNLCPHVKRVLDRAMADDLPDLAGVVVMLSCDAMRRLADAWRVARPGDPLAVVDLPVGNDEASVRYLATELAGLADQMVEWGGEILDDGELAASCSAYSQLSESLTKLSGLAADGNLQGGRAALQELLDLSVTEPVEHTMAEAERLLEAPAPVAPHTDRVPIFVVGNVLPGAEAFELLDTCGVRVVGDDLCTGSRQITAVDVHAEGAEGTVIQLARAILTRPPCARTVLDAEPGGHARGLVASARSSGARGVIIHVMKFCDPYLARLPGIRDGLRSAGLPSLVLEGDCTMRSLGQHRTRIEAFVEMLA